jgi:hypothetical protein
VASEIGCREIFAPHDFPKRRGFFFQREADKRGHDSLTAPQALHIFGSEATCLRLHQMVRI